MGGSWEEVKEVEEDVVRCGDISDCSVFAFCFVCFLFTGQETVREKRERREEEWGSVDEFMEKEFMEKFALKVKLKSPV